MVCGAEVGAEVEEEGAGGESGAEGMSTVEGAEKWKGRVAAEEAAVALETDGAEERGVAEEIEDFDFSFALFPSFCLPPFPTTVQLEVGAVEVRGIGEGETFLVSQKGFRGTKGKEEADIFFFGEGAGFLAWTPPSRSSSPLPTTWPKDATKNFRSSLDIPSIQDEI